MEIMDSFTAIFDSHLVYSLGWTIVHSFWQCLIVVSLLKICLLLSKQARPQTRYWLSLFSLACCLFISVKTFIVYYQDISTASQFYAHLQESINVSANTLWSASFQIINPWLDSIVFIWCIGLLFQGYRFVADIIFTQKLKHQAVSNLPQQWEQQLQYLVSKIEIKAKVNFLQSSKVNIPVVIGYLKPVILLPLGILTQLPEAQIKAIVLHELAHIKRHDYLINVVQCIIKVLFFFNPFVLAISKNIDVEREKACDDVAVKISGDPLTFVRGLSNFAEASMTSTTALAATKDQYFLLARVKRLLSKKQRLTQATERLIALLCIGMLGLTINVHANNHTALASSFTEVSNTNTALPIEPINETESFERSVVSQDNSEQKLVLDVTTPTATNTKSELVNLAPDGVSDIQGEVSNNRKSSEASPIHAIQSLEDNNSQETVLVANTAELTPSAIDYIERNEIKEGVKKVKLAPAAAEVTLKKEQEKENVNALPLIADNSLTNSISISEADRLFENKDYQKAKEGYLAAAKLGSPHAFYQLGTILFKGLGVRQDPLSAYVWFSLATEYNFNDSEQVAKQIFTLLSDKQQHESNQLLSKTRHLLSKDKIQIDYYPIIRRENLHKKVTFGGEGENNNDNGTDELFGITGTATDSLSDKDFDTFDELDELDDIFDYYDDLDEIDNIFDPAHRYVTTKRMSIGDDIQGSYFVQKSPLNLPVLALIDYEVAVDGSIRNINKEYSKGRAGNLNTAIFNYSRHKLPKPTFDGKRISFFNRGYIGITRFDTGEVRERHGYIYNWVKRNDKRLKKQNTDQSQYSRAMLLTYFPWFPQEEGLTVSLLKNLAEKGHTDSQYEYGMYLYREQLDPAQGVKYLSLASQFGLAKAQYALARILQESPWVVTDENKAMFWYAKAANKAHPSAFLKLAELKLLAKDESLRDHEAAIDILNNIEKVQEDNPEYNYLLALAHLKGEFRDSSKVVKHLRLAISRGQTLEWDVSKWEEQLERWTTGHVTING